MNEDCIFCKIVSGEIGTKKVYEDEEILAFEDINPQAPIHILVIPKHHIQHLEDASEEQKELLGKMLIVARDIARDKGIAEKGYRLVLNTNPDSGQEVYHLHFHLLGGRRFTWPPG